MCDRAARMPSTWRGVEFGLFTFKILKAKRPCTLTPLALLARTSTPGNRLRDHVIDSATFGKLRAKRPCKLTPLALLARKSTPGNRLRGHAIDSATFGKLGAKRPCKFAPLALIAWKSTLGNLLRDRVIHSGGLCHARYPVKGARANFK